MNRSRSQQLASMAAEGGSPARAVLDQSVTERDFSAQVGELARLRNWQTYHTLDSRGSAAGFPDWVFVRPPRLVYAELKTERGRVSREQERWLMLLRQCGAEVHLWRPRDWDAIKEALR